MLKQFHTNYEYKSVEQSAKKWTQKNMQFNKAQKKRNKIERHQPSCSKKKINGTQKMHTLHSKHNHGVKKSTDVCYHNIFFVLL